MMVHVDNPMEFTKKLLMLISELIKVAGYRVNLQKSGVFLYAIALQCKSEILGDKFDKKCVRLAH